MTDLIILAIVAVAVVLGVRAALPHFRGKGGCCGSADYKAKSKKLRTVAEKHTLRVEGMMCQNCVNRVMEALQSLEGVSAAVDLKKGLVTVSAGQPVDPQALKAAVEKAGYTVTEIA